jgi:hypothetical protein
MNNNAPRTSSPPLAWLCAACLLACGASASERRSELAGVLEKIERVAKDEDVDAFSKFYVSACKLEDSAAVQRRVAHLAFDTAERIKRRHYSEFVASAAAWESARGGAVKDVRYFLGDPDCPGQKTTGKKFDPNNPAYKAATEKHKDLLAKISKCFPFYTKAQEAFGAVLRLTPTGKDFDAAGHLPLCLTVKNELHTIMRARKLLREFLDTYKPGDDTERALYKRCEDELEQVTRNCK